MLCWKKKKLFFTFCHLLPFDMREGSTRSVLHSNGNTNYFGSVDLDQNGFFFFISKVAEPKYTFYVNYYCKLKFSQNGNRLFLAPQSLILFFFFFVRIRTSTSLFLSIQCFPSQNVSYQNMALFSKKPYVIIMHM